MENLKGANAKDIQFTIDKNRQKLEEGNKFDKMILSLLEQRLEQQVQIEENVAKDADKRKKKRELEAELETISQKEELSRKEAKRRLDIEKWLQSQKLQLIEETNKDLTKSIEDSLNNQLKANEDEVENEINLFVSNEQSKRDEADRTDKILKEIDDERIAKKEEDAKKEQQIEEEKAQRIIGISQELGSAVNGLISGQTETFKDFAKEILKIGLNQLKIQAQMAVASATVQSLAQPDSVATFGATGLVRAAILQGLIEVAFAGLNGIIDAFEYGTDNAPGEFIAGEKGRELMRLKTGEMIMAESATHFKGNKYKGATIYSNPETEKIIAESNRNNNFIFDTTDLRDEMRAVRKAIQSKPVSITDKSGRIIGYQENSYREIYLNRLRNGR